MIDARAVQICAQRLCEKTRRLEFVVDDPNINEQIDASLSIAIVPSSIHIKNGRLNFSTIDFSSRDQVERILDAPPVKSEREWAEILLHPSMRYLVSPSLQKITFWSWIVNFMPTLPNPDYVLQCYSARIDYVCALMLFSNEILFRTLREVLGDTWVYRKIRPDPPISDLPPPPEERPRRIRARVTDDDDDERMLRQVYEQRKSVLVFRTWVDAANWVATEKQISVANHRIVTPPLVADGGGSDENSTLISEEEPPTSSDDDAFFSAEDAASNAEEVEEEASNEEEDASNAEEEEEVEASNGDGGAVLDAALNAEEDAFFSAEDAASNAEEDAFFSAEDAASNAEEEEEEASIVDDGAVLDAASIVDDGAVLDAEEEVLASSEEEGGESLVVENEIVASSAPVQPPVISMPISSSIITQPTSSVIEANVSNVQHSGSVIQSTWSEVFNIRGLSSKPPEIIPQPKPKPVYKLTQKDPLDIETGLFRYVFRGQMMEFSIGEIDLDILRDIESRSSEIEALSLDSVQSNVFRADVAKVLGKNTVYARAYFSFLSKKIMQLRREFIEIKNAVEAE